MVTHTTRARGPLGAARVLLLAPLLALPSCSGWLFSGVRTADRSAPVVRIETRGGTELGAGTDHGVLFLGRTAQSGPCRVSWLVGGSVYQEEGEIQAYGSVFYRADMQLRTQEVPLLLRRPGPEDELVAILPDLEGGGVERLPVALVPGEQGFLQWPGRPLPAGTPVFTSADTPQLVGLVAGELSMDGGRRLIVAGLDPLREAWLLPRNHPGTQENTFRPDDMIIRRSADPQALPKR